MASIVNVPPGLRPADLAYREELPEVMGAILDKGALHWHVGETHRAIQAAEQALALAIGATPPHAVGECVAAICLSDWHATLNQFGLAEKYAQQATRAFQSEPNYPHKSHAEAVISYLRGLLRHALGDTNEALTAYQEALSLFGQAIVRWRSRVISRSDVAQRCESAHKWIDTLYRQCMNGDEGGVDGAIALCIPKLEGDDYGITRLDLIPVVSPFRVAVNGKLYSLCDCEDGNPVNRPFPIEWDKRYFLVPVESDGWAGPHSAAGDYVLASRPLKVENRPCGGLLWDDGVSEWEYGQFIRDSSGRVWFQKDPPPRLIGGRDSSKMGIVRALLKP